MTHYIATDFMPKSFPGELIVRQPIPEGILGKIHFKNHAGGLQFHVMEKLYPGFSIRIPGIHMQTDEWTTVFARVPESDTFWIICSVRPDILEQKLNDIYLLAPELAVKLSSLRPMSDWTEFKAKHTRLIHEREIQQEEEARGKAREKAEQHAEQMREAGEKFLNGSPLPGHLFCDLLHHHGLWHAIHPRTKYFFNSSLVSVSKKGDYSAYQKKGSKGSSQIGPVVKLLIENLTPKPVALAEQPVTAETTATGGGIHG